MHTIDDRGQRVRLEHIPHRLYATADSIPRKLHPMQLYRLQRAERYNVIVMIALIILTLATMAAPIGLLGLGWTCSGLLLMLATIITMVWWSVRRLDRIYAIHHLPSARVCPSCGHSLRGLQPDTDDCTVCPECGAAWRIPATDP